ncbi:hypothetical protein [Methanobrevibacter sp.]|uniref:MSCRAMM family protein n=1 Tax=Methanobrevibacter sp. TaxID=66852 RepID=UPI00386874CA
MFKKRYIAVLFLIILVLMTISSVNAEELNATDESVHGNFDDDVLEDAHDYHSFSELQNIINDACRESFISTDNYFADVSLEHDYAYNPKVDSESLKDGITLPKDLEDSGILLDIYGRGHTIYGNGSRIFNFAENDQINIFNVNFVNNLHNGVSNGGSIYNEGAVLLKNCNFSDNSVKNEGGAIYNSQSGAIKIVKCNFLNNDAQNYGGAISSYGEIDIEESSFNNCYSTYGGAISSYNYGTISYSTFTANLATYGGAIYNHLPDDRKIFSSLNTFYSNFTNNEATDGGAIYNAFASYCHFTKDNKAKNGNYMFSGLRISCSDDEDYEYNEDLLAKNYYGTVESGGFSFKINNVSVISHNEVRCDILVTNNNDGKPVSCANVNLRSYNRYFDDEYDRVMNDYHWSHDSNNTNQEGISSFNVYLSEGSYINDEYVALIFLSNPVYNDTIISDYQSSLFQLDSSIVFTNDIVFDHGGVGSTNFTLTGAYDILADVVNHTEAVISFANNTLFVSGLEPGKYILHASTWPYFYCNPVEATLNVTVRPIPRVTFSAGIVFDYASSGTVHMIVEGGRVERRNIQIVGHPEAIISLVNNEITISGLNPGQYTLHVVSTPDEGLEPAVGTVGVTVKKATAVIQASKVTVAVKKGNLWTIRLVDSKTGKPISNMKLQLKVFTGKKYKAVSLTTDSNGQARYQTKALSIGTHKVEVGGTHFGYTFNTLKSSISVIKPKALTFKIQKRSNDKRGSLVSFIVMDKKTKKGINGVKVKLLLYTGKNYVTINLKTKKVGKYSGAVGYSTNKLSVGKHKVVIVPAEIKYSGSKSTSMTIKKSAKKYPAWETKVSA